MTAIKMVAGMAGSYGPGRASATEFSSLPGFVRLSE